MSHIEALEEVIKLQKEKIVSLEKDVQELKAKPQQITFDYTTYLEKQKTCVHEYDNNYGLLGSLGRTCKKCGLYSANYATNPQPFIGGGSIQINPQQPYYGTLQVQGVAGTTYAQTCESIGAKSTSGLNQGDHAIHNQTFHQANQNLCLVPESERNRQNG